MFQKALINSDSCEFFYHESNVKALLNGRVIEFQDFPVELLDSIRNEMEADKKIIPALEKMGAHDPMSQVEQFLICRYGSFNNDPDYGNPEGNDIEYYNCGMRNTCPFQGIVCKQFVTNDGVLGWREMEIIKLMTEDITDKEIAARLFISEHTARKHRQNITKKLNVHSKVGIAVWAAKKGIV